MSAQEMVGQFKTLALNEREQVARFVLQEADSWIPESFQRGMADAEAGRFEVMDNRLLLEDDFDLKLVKYAEANVPASGEGRMGVPCKTTSLNDDLRIRVLPDGVQPRCQDACGGLRGEVNVAPWRQIHSAHL